MNIADRIMAVRRQIPDMPGSLPAPTAVWSTPVVAGATLPAGTYFAVLTQFNAYGESVASVESAQLTVAAGSGVRAAYTPSPDATSVRLYLTLVGGASGTESTYVDAVCPSSGLGGTITASAYPLPSGFPPTRPTAFLPGTNGRRFTVETLYEWLNDGLNKLSHAVGGILDYCGVPTLSGQPLYKIPGQWLTITDVWYGGYWIQGGERMWFYRRNAVTTDILSGVTISVQSDKQVMEVSYQPDRTSGVTATTGAIGTGDAQVGIGNSGVFLLSFGFAMFSGPNLPPEIVAYSNLNGNIMSGLIRGIGNTVAQAWPSGSTVTELSLFWCGRRIFNTPYSPVPVLTPATGLVGPADPITEVIPVPYGWGPILDMYMLAQAKKADLDLDAWKKLEDEAFKQAQAWMYGNRGVNQRVQVGGINEPVVFYPTIAGGTIVP